MIWTEFHRANGGYLLRFPELGDFQVSADGLTVTCFPAPRVSDATSEHLYLNQVLPLVLSKLGKLVFHASAVEPARCGGTAPPGFPFRAGGRTGESAVHYRLDYPRCLEELARVREAILEHAREEGIAG
jgi:hypothetical protein